MFAPAKVGGGNLSWEACQNICGDNTEAFFPNQGNVYDVECQGDNHQWQTRYAVCIPANITRGVVTLRRLHATWGALAIIDTLIANRRHSQPMLLGIQLAPFSLDPTTGGMFARDVLSMRNVADLENPRILYNALWLPEDSVSPGNDRQWSRDIRIDVRTMRRWDRQQWGLIFTLDWETAKIEETDTMWYLHCRMLFSAYDAL